MSQEHLGETERTVQICSTLTASVNRFREAGTKKDFSGILDLNSYLQQTHQIPPHADLIDEKKCFCTKSVIQASYTHYAIARAARNRRFFVTASGCTGLGPQTMQADDIVVVLFGGDLPFVLRACPDKVAQASNESGDRKSDQDIDEDHDSQYELDDDQMVYDVGDDKMVSEGVWEMIGPCYVDGIMYGEAVQRAREDGIAPKMFHIQ